MPIEWKNLIKRVKAPHLPKQIIEPVPLEDVNSLLRTCRGDSFFDKRDRAKIFFLLDTGARAQEVCNINLPDVELSIGQVTIRQGKGREPRYVFINRTTIKALRAYLRIRDNLKTEALFLSKTMDFDLLASAYDQTTSLRLMRNPIGSLIVANVSDVDEPFQ